MEQVIIETSRRHKAVTDDVKNFNNIIRKSNNVLNESDIEHMGQWLENCDCAFITNREKNKLMVAELITLGYGVTKITGVYPEGMTGECAEEGCFVVNRNNDENILDKLLRIAEFYNQDSIYYKEKGKAAGNLIGINTASNYMSRLGDKAFSFVRKGAEKTENHAKAMLEFVDFWRNMTEGGMLIKEDIHPVTRMVMGQELREMKRNKVK